MRGYIIVTPTKNEARNLRNIIGFVDKQTIKPSLWVIVDESSDNTPNIIKEVMTRYKWIRGIFLERREGYLGKGYAAACKAGFDYAIKDCKQNKIDYEYIGLVDADVSISEDYFERLISKFERNPKLGIASGIEYWDISGKLVKNDQREDLPIGPARLWRKECFLETEGYIVSEAPPDTISNIKAKLRGWETEQFADVKVITRRASTGRGYWKGYLQNGKYSYAVHDPLFIAIMKAIKYSFNHPYYTGLAFLSGYLISAIRRVEKVNENEIKAYVRHKKPKELFTYYTNKIKKR